GGRALGAPADVRNLVAVEAAVGSVGDALGPIDVLVNNAGWERLAPFLESDPALWDRLIAVNFKGALNATRAVVQGMVARGRGRRGRLSRLRRSRLRDRAGAERVGRTHDGGVRRPFRTGWSRPSRGARSPTDPRRTASRG